MEIVMWHEARQVPSWLIFDVRQNMKCLPLILALLLFGSSASFGRLGESEKELAARFGPPASRTPEKAFAQGKFYDLGLTLRFRQGDWTIESTIIDDRSAREVYQKRGEWTDEQMTTVLNSNSQGARWSDITNAGTRKILRKWRRDDGATAEWKMGVMTLTHPAFDRAKKVVEAKAKAEVSRSPKI